MRLKKVIVKLSGKKKGKIKKEKRKKKEVKNRRSPLGSFPWFLPAILVEEKWCFLSEFEVPEPQGEVETLPEPVELQKPSTMATAGIATSRPLTLLLFLIINLLSNTITGGGGGGGRVYADNGVFSVRYKYAGRERCLSTLKAHDISRQLRFLAGVDIPLGGSGRPDAVGLVVSFFNFVWNCMC